MIKLRWAPFPEANVAHYRIYRSMVGVKVYDAAPSTVNGKTLILKIGSTANQTITFDGVLDTIDKVNSVLVGARAYASIPSPLYFYIRSDVREAPGSIQVVGGTALIDLGLTARTVSEKSEDELIATVAALPNPNTIVEYEDADGVLQDFYAISTVDSFANESLKTQYRQPVCFSGPVCVLEGVIINLHGARVPDAVITATLVSFPHESSGNSNVTLDPVETLSGPDGRFSLPILQGALVHLEIPAIGYSKNLTVPAKSFEFVTDLVVDLDYRYPLGTEV